MPKKLFKKNNTQDLQEARLSTEFQLKKINLFLINLCLFSERFID